MFLEAFHQSSRTLVALAQVFPEHRAGLAVSLANSTMVVISPGGGLLGYDWITSQGGVLDCSEAIASLQLSQTQDLSVFLLGTGQVSLVFAPTSRRIALLRVAPEGVMHWATGDDSIPVGASFDFWGQYPPIGYLIVSSTAVSRSEYPELFVVLGTRYGEGDGSTTFNLPPANGATSKIIKAYRVNLS